MSNDQLVEMTRGGGDGRDKALSYIYTKWRNSACRILLAKGGDITKIQDVIHNAMIILDRKIREPKFKLQGSLKNYFFSICKYQYITPERKVLQATFHTHEEQKLDRPNEVNQEFKMLSESCKQIISDMLNMVDGKCRTALFFYKLGYSMEAIAFRINTTPDAAKDRVHKCLKKIRDRVIGKPNLKECLQYL